MLELDTVRDGLHFAENPRWRDGRLWFSDMYADEIHRWDPATGADEVVGELLHPAGLGWLPDGRLLAVATEDLQVLVVGPQGNELYVDLSEHVAAWANEMLVDEHGRAYVGNFGFDLFGGEPCETHLLIIEPDRTVRRGPEGLNFPNGTVRRSDGRLAVAETFAHRIALFDIAADGSLTATGTIALGDDVTPDGICIDADDGIWAASPLTGEMVYAAADGTVTRHEIGHHPYACMLGGADRRTLFVAAAPDHTPENRRAETAGVILAGTVEVPGVGADGLGAPC